MYGKKIHLRDRIHRRHKKPVALYRWLLDWYGPGNREDELFRATVFDPFAGSGSLGVACKERGYDYVGCEVSKVFFDAACERLGIEDGEGGNDA